MEDVRALELQTLKASIGASTYKVDPVDVAEAILRRPSARLWLIPRGVELYPPSPPEAASGEVVETS